jgi:nitrogen regulatory protein P-II 1
MSHLLIFVLNNLEQYPVILDAWEEAGAPGITILESTGVGHIRSAVRDDLPLMPSLRDLLASQEMHHRTLFTVIKDEKTLDKVIEATERVIGDFTRHHTGLLFVVPVSRVLGLDKEEDSESWWVSSS